MYCKFFGLAQPPFNNTPDARFFFQTPQHEEALASLRYTAEQRKGFVLVTGEVGSGKTLLGRMVIQQLGGRARTATISSSSLSPHDFMANLCQELDVPYDPDANKVRLTQFLQDYLLDKYAKDRLVVLLLDEAQNLPIESFEELRMLSNLEADDAKLLQVLILGQPELLDVLRQPGMRQLQQRIVRTVHLTELSREETVGYINYRLLVAGGSGKVAFAEQAIDLIHLHSSGLPRMINQICDQCLLTAYARSVTEVSETIAQEVVDNPAARQMSGSWGPGRASAGESGSACQEPTSSSNDARRQAKLAAFEERAYDAELNLDRLGRHASQIIDKVNRKGEAACEAIDESLSRKTQEARDALSDIRQDTDRIVKKAHKRSEKIEESVAESLETTVSGAEKGLEKLKVEADQLVESTAHRGQEAQRSITESLETTVSGAEKGLEKLKAEADQLVESTAHRGQEAQRSITESLTEKLGGIQKSVSRFEAEADSISESTLRRGEETRQLIADSMEEKLAEIRTSLQELRTHADRITETTARRGEALQQALTEEVSQQAQRTKDTIAAFREESDKIATAAEHKKAEIQQSLAQGFEENTNAFRETLEGFDKESGSLIEDVTRQGREIHESFSRDMETKIGEVHQTLGKLSKDTNRLVRKNFRRSRILKKSLAEELNGKTAQADEVVKRFEQHVDSAVDGGIRKSVDQHKRVLAEHEKQTAELCETLDSTRTEAAALVNDSAGKVTDLRELCKVLRTSMNTLSKDVAEARTLSATLAEENAKTQSLAPLIQDARQTITLLGQAHQHANEHTSKLTHQVDRAEALFRDVPQLIVQLQSSTKAAKSASAELAKGLRQLEVGKKQIGEWLSRADHVFSVLDVLGNAIGSARTAEQDHPFSSTGQNAEGHPAGSQGSNGPKPRGTVAASGRQPGRGLAEEEVSADGIPALIEFDPRRAAMAQRIAKATRGSILRREDPQTTVAKHA